jgi:hypothetical protein
MNHDLVLDGILVGGRAAVVEFHFNDSSSHGTRRLGVSSGSKFCEKQVVEKKRCGARSLGFVRSHEILAHVHFHSHSPSTCQCRKPAALTHKRRNSEYKSARKA